MMAGETGPKVNVRQQSPQLPQSQLKFAGTRTEIDVVFDMPAAYHLRTGSGDNETVGVLRTFKIAALFPRSL